MSEAEHWKALALHYRTLLYDAMQILRDLDAGNEQLLADLKQQAG